MLAVFKNWSEAISDAVDGINRDLGRRFIEIGHKHSAGSAQHGECPRRILGQVIQEIIKVRDASTSRGPFSEESLTSVAIELPI